MYSVFAVGALDNSLTNELLSHCDLWINLAVYKEKCQGNKTLWTFYVNKNKNKLSTKAVKANNNLG